MQLKEKTVLKKLRILLIEDDTIEVMKFTRVITSLNLNHTITVANNGNQALEILEHKDNLPNIILLDLNMPMLNGIEFLTILKKDKELKFIPTIILTTSNNQSDLLECYKVGIAGYVLKPLKYKDYISRIKHILSYWSINELT